MVASGGAWRVGEKGKGGRKVPTSCVADLKVANKVELQSSHRKNIFYKFVMVTDIN